MAEGLGSVDAAQARILELLGSLPEAGTAAAPPGAGHAAETLPIGDALGRILAAPITAAVRLPPWDNSAMDGYALHAADTVGVTGDAPRRVAVVGEVAAGVAPDRAVEPGTAIRIATGAPMPPGADAVVPVELTTPVDASGATGARGRDAAGPLPAAVLVHVPVAIGANVRRAGSDLERGQVLLETGTALGPAQLTLAAGAGVGAAAVHRRPRIGVLATGDELTPAGAPLGPASIPDANGPGLRALVTRAGGDALDLGIARDQLPDVQARLEAGLAAGCDAIVVSGGVSVGPYDVVKAAFEALGEVDLWRVAVQPGKPFALATVRRPAGSTAAGSHPAPGSVPPGSDAPGPVLLFGLPGNPVSGFVTFELFVRPAIRRLAGRRDPFRPLDRGVLLDEARTSRDRRAYLRVTADREEAGAVARDPSGRALVRLSRGPEGQGSHVLTAMAAADALAIVPEGVETLAAGGAVDLLWLDAE